MILAPWHIAILLFFVAPLYFLPAIVAAARKTRALAGIVALNVLLGWSGLGWVGALIWAFTAETKTQAQLRELAYTHMARGTFKGD